MAFSEELKLEVKKKAMFQCCRCQAISVEVHHIDPQHDQGSDTIDNAAPLCPNCHSWFGDNPLKKKEIKQMRNNWYEVVNKKYSGQSNVLIPLVEKINKSLSAQSTDINQMKTMLKEISNKAIDNMTLGTANVTASNVVNASTATLSGMRLSGWCSNCDEYFDFAPNNICPRCGLALP